VGRGAKKKGHLFFTCPLSIEPTLFNMFLTCHVICFSCNVSFFVSVSKCEVSVVRILQYSLCIG